MASVNSIRPEELQALRVSGQHPRLIDVRTPAEFDEVHAVGATSIPLDRLDPTRITIQHGVQPTETVYVICKMGGRSRRACQALDSAGFANVVNVDGGTDAWVAANLPVVRTGQKTFAIHRQVQILSGCLVLLGVVLGKTVSPAFFVVSGLIGLGLVVSGITDTCGMATMLAKMPWNRPKKSKAAPQIVAEACGGSGG